MKGILLVGGYGKRLSPVTIAVSKQLLPIYDKPMCFYPMSILMLMGIRDVLIISDYNSITKYGQLFGTGQFLGMNFEYEIQEKPEGIPQAYILAEEFLGGESSCLILGDNVFYGHEMISDLSNCSGNTIFITRVKDPERYGVVKFGLGENIEEIVEKPKTHISDWAITGLYVFDNQAVEIAKGLKKSERDEYEITDMMREYIYRGNLKTKKLGRGIAWLDTGTFKSLAQASEFIMAIQERQGLKVACLEEIAYNKKFIDSDGLESIIKNTDDQEMVEYLKSLLIK